MDRYIGIDAHSKSCTVAVMGPSGKRIKQQVLDTQAKVLIDFMKGVAGDKYVCIEEGELAAWLVEVLSPHVKEISVVQPTKPQGRKSDEDDAWALAEQIRVRAKATYVFKPTTQYRSLREAVRTHGFAVKDQARSKNRFRALLRSRGISNLDESIYDPSQRENWIGKLPPAYHPRAAWLGRRLDMATEAYDEALQWLKKQARSCQDVKRLMTVVGLGEIRAAQIVAIVVTPHRFRTTRKFWSYCGLAIVTHASAEWARAAKGRNWERIQNRVQTRGLNRNMQPMLKSIFKGAALTALAGSNALREHFDRLVAQGTPNHLARLTIARRIAAATLAIWKKKEEYDPSKHRSHQEAA